MGKLYRPVSGKYIDFKSIILPVGYVYISYNNVDPNTLFYGTWVRVTGAYLMSGDPSSSMSHKTIGSTVGSWAPNTNSTTLTLEQIPEHSHTYPGYIISPNGNWPGGWDKVVVYGQPQGTLSYDFSVSSAGGGKGHTHKLPNYPVNTIVLNVWRRSA